MAQDPLKYFRIEARELLEGLAQGALALEKGAAGGDVVDRLLRLAHTLKGASRVVRQPAIAELAHTVESALAPYREKGGPVPAEPARELLRLVDAIGDRIKSLEPAAEPGHTGTRPAADEAFETVRVEIGEMDALLDGVFEARTRLTALRRDLAAIEPALRLARALAERLGERRGGENGSAAPPTAKVRALAEDVRTSLERLQRGWVAGLDETEREMDQVRERASRIRLLPANTIFAALERAARDAAQALHKRIDFETRGGEHRLDAHVLAALRDALLHGVRNAAAHGIESESERLAAGKPPAGRIRIEVERRGTLVVFACRDDGRGIDVEAIRRVAVRRGLIPAAEAGSLGLDQAVQIILKGGVTTTGELTEVAGRGVGLCVVRDTAARLKGEVTVRSERARGTTVQLSVPVSLSSQTALLVDAGGLVAAIPLDAVRGTLKIAAGDVAGSAHGESVLFGDKAVPYVPLARILRSHAAPDPRRAQARTSRTPSRPAVVVQFGAARAAVGVDRLLGTGNVVVRPLPALAEIAAVVTGASLDAEGNPWLFLDPGALVQAAGAGMEPAAGPAVPRRTPILVVDDSLTTRMLEQSILESAGYEVDLATSGEEALGKARERPYSLFVVDVEMPGMDGFAFVERTRSDPVLRGVPAILVTSRGSPEDRRRGEQAGARAYIFKGEFDQGLLLQTIRTLVGDQTG